MADEPPMPDPAPLTAEDEQRIVDGKYLAQAIRLHFRGLWLSEGEKALARLLAALDAAEARLADARREALEEAAKLCEAVAHAFAPLNSPESQARRDICECLRDDLRDMAAPRPTEETTP